MRISNGTLAATATYQSFPDDRFHTNWIIPVRHELTNNLSRSFMSPKPGIAETLHHQVRMNYLTASNVAAVLGHNPYCSPQNAFKRYVLKTQSGGSKATRKGQEMEPIIARLFVERSNLPCVHGEGLCISRRHSFLAATFDLLTYEGIPVEIKTLVTRKPKLNELMPFYYWIQCQVQMEVAEAPYCYYVEYKEESEGEGEYFAVHKIARDASWMQSMLPRLATFWNQVLALRAKLNIV